MKRLLILDDDPDFLELAELILKRHYTVHIHSSLKDVETVIATVAPDLILIDHFYDPGYTAGTEINIAEVIAKSSVPFILYSAHPLVAERARNYKAVGFIEKPSSVVAIREYLQEYFKNMDE